MAEQFPDAPLEVDLVERHINHFFDHLFVCLDQRRVELISEARNMREEIAARPAARLREEKELIAFKTETENRLQMNELHETQQEILAKLDEKLVEIRKPRPETHFMFKANSQELEQLIQTLGEVVEEEVSKVPQYHKMHPIVAVAKDGKGPGDLSLPSGVAIDPISNQIFVTEGCSRVSVFTESGDYINSFSHEHMKWPWGIAIHEDNVYVTDLKEHFVFQFKLSADIRLVARVGGRGYGEGQFNDPKQLSVSSDGNLFVSDCCNDRIQILDRDLHFQRSISHESMIEPTDVKLTSDSVYVLTPVNSPNIHVFSYTGDKISSLLNSSEDDMVVTNPNFFCLDYSLNIIVSDPFAQQVKIFTREGTLLHTIGEYGHEKGKFFSPYGVAITNNLNLVVVSWNDNCRLQIFSDSY